MPAIPVASEMRRMALFFDHHAARADDCAAAQATHGVRIVCRTTFRNEKSKRTRLLTRAAFKQLSRPAEHRYS